MKDIIVTGSAPKPIGPYSQAVRANEFLFTAQIELDPNTNTLLEGDVAQQNGTLENLKASLTRAELPEYCSEWRIATRDRLGCRST